MIKRFRIPIIVLFVLPVLLPYLYAGQTVTDAPAGPVIKEFSTNLAGYPGGEVPRYEKFEITLALEVTYSNPFDPDDLRIDGYFISPNNQIWVQPGFYYQDYLVTRDGENETYTPNGSPAWKVRFAPSEIGQYQFYVRVTDNSGTVESSPDTFQAVNSSNPGFVRVSESNSRYFEFSSGEPFFGYGLNIAWWQLEHRRLSTYEYYLDRMGAYGANLARVWMTNSGKNQDWILSIQDDQLGSDYNLEEAWAFDQILEKARQKGVYFLLTLEDVNQYTYNWDNNLYNYAIGGPLTFRSEIFTHSEARHYQERVFRYILARWGYSPNIFSWELFNEIDELQWSDPDHWNWQALINWHAEIGRYIRALDAHGHLVNTSTGSFKTHPDLYGLPEMGFAQIHFYYVPGCCNYAPSDPTGRDMADLSRYYAHRVYGSLTGKPAMIGEWGLMDEFWNPSPWLASDDQGVHLHNGLWSSLMSGMAVTGLNWHWSVHRAQDPAWWEHYRAIASYFEGISLSNLAVLKPVNVDFSLPGGADDRPEDFSSTNSSLRVMGLRAGGFIYGWIQNRGNTWWNYTQGTPPATQSGTITVYNLPAGMSYTVEWWDTYAAGQQIIASEELTVGEAGSLQLDISGLEKDIAFKLRPSSQHKICVPVIVK
ncbi:MAG TPA: DUF5060 domain-containing protein [Anaerolineales bacterium]|nr:DUF5060 domain-containing protein [Anaerolineales bacterium]